jgi:hypothetical protein
MNGLLAKIGTLLGTHPEIAVIVATGLILVVLIWGVVSSSYRYR